MPNPISTPPQPAPLELIYAGRVIRREGFCEIPTSVFVNKIDVNMPALPSVAFFKFGADGKPNQIRGPTQAYSPLALSINPTIWVREEDFGIVRSFAENMILGKALGSGPKEPSSIPVEKRMEMLRKSAILCVEDLFNNPTPENITKSVKIVGSFVYVIMKDPQAYLFLSKLSSHDPYTLQHSVGTAVHSIILARKLGINDESELTNAGMGGLLHDIGKTKVKKEIINKQGPLDEIEWEEMRGHASEGFELVKDQPGLSDLSKRAVIEHHEDKNGTGYPTGRLSSETHVYSRIVGLCDIFNALTTDRSYSKARTPFEAFQLMREKLMYKIDAELFKELVLVYGGKL